MGNWTFIEGEHDLTVYVGDDLGNNESYRWIYFIDDSPITSIETSLGNGAMYGDDVEFVLIYFSEQPAVVLGSWNGEENVSYPFIPQPAMRLDLNQQGSKMGYVQIVLPKEIWENHQLTLFVQDDAGNWSVFEFNWHKIDFPVLIIGGGLLVIIGAVIGYSKRERIKQWFFGEEIITEQKQNQTTTSSKPKPKKHKEQLRKKSLKRYERKHEKRK